MFHTDGSVFSQILHHSVAWCILFFWTELWAIFQLFFWILLCWKKLNLIELLFFIFLCLFVSFILIPILYCSGEISAYLLVQTMNRFFFNSPKETAIDCRILFHCKHYKIFGVLLAVPDLRGACLWGGKQLKIKAGKKEK